MQKRLQTKAATVQTKYIDTLTEWSLITYHQLTQTECLCRWDVKLKVIPRQNLVIQ